MAGGIERWSSRGGRPCSRQECRGVLRAKWSSSPAPVAPTASGARSPCALRLRERRSASLDLDGARAGLVADEVSKRGGEALADNVRRAALRGVRSRGRHPGREVYGGHIDILVNNAATFSGRTGPYHPRPFEEWTTDEWDTMLDVNLRGMWFCVRAVYPYMKAQGYGKIVNVGSSTFWEGVSRPRALCRQQGRRHRVHAVSGPRARTRRHPGQLSLPRLHADGHQPGASSGAGLRGPDPPEAVPAPSGTRWPTIWPGRPSISPRPTATS